MWRQFYRPTHPYCSSETCANMQQTWGDNHQKLDLDYRPSALTSVQAWGGLASTTIALIPSSYDMGTRWPSAGGLKSHPNCAGPVWYTILDDFSSVIKKNQNMQIKILPKWHGELCRWKLRYQAVAAVRRGGREAALWYSVPTPAFLSWTRDPLPTTQGWQPAKTMQTDVWSWHVRLIARKTTRLHRGNNNTHIWKVVHVWCDIYTALLEALQRERLTSAVKHNELDSLVIKKRRRRSENK